MSISNSTLRGHQIIKQHHLSHFIPNRGSPGSRLYRIVFGEITDIIYHGGRRKKPLRAKYRNYKIYQCRLAFCSFETGVYGTVPVLPFRPDSKCLSTLFGHLLVIIVIFFRINAFSRLALSELSLEECIFSIINYDNVLFF